MKINLENIRLHRDDDNKENSFYWDITTGLKVDESLIPQFAFTPELQMTK